MGHLDSEPGSSFPIMTATKQGSPHSPADPHSSSTKLSIACVGPLSVPQHFRIGLSFMSRLLPYLRLLLSIFSVPRFPFTTQRTF